MRTRWKFAIFAITLDILLAFLKCSEFSIPCAEPPRENAHAVPMARKGRRNLLRRKNKFLSKFQPYIASQKLQSILGFKCV